MGLGGGEDSVFPTSLKLDLGTGSAVLAIALAKLCRIPVLATDSDPVAVTTRMADAGTIVVQMRRGGAMLYLPGEAPAGDGKNSGSKALEKMLSA